jgi:hypothetical protein
VLHCTVSYCFAVTELCCSARGVLPQHFPECAI